MESMTKASAKRNLNEEFYFGKDLSNESNFLGEVKKIFNRELNVDVGTFYNNKVITVSIKLNKTDLEISKKLIFNIDLILDVYFDQKKALFEISWCSSYMIDKRKIASEKNLDEFCWVNVSPNRRVYEKEGEKNSLIPFLLCNCFNCKTIAELTL